jgi:hypothetical protein
MRKHHFAEESFVPAFCFLKIGLRSGGGIAGESLNMDYPRWIEIERWSPGGPTGLEAGSGKRTDKFRSGRFSFVKRVDSTSGRLFSAWRGGDYFDGAILAIEGPGTPQLYQFLDVQISDVNGNVGTVSAPDARAEGFTIAFAGMARLHGATSLAGFFGPPAVKSAKAAFAATALTIAASLAPHSVPGVAGALQR